MRADTLRLTCCKSTFLALSLIILSLCGLSHPAYAQEVTATINGSVTDQAGAVVANADVVAKDIDRGTTWKTKTNAEGYYHLGRLPIGRYEVRVAAAGFSTAVQPQVELQLNQVVPVNVRLAVGKTTESVNVTSEVPLLQTETATVGTIIDEKTNVDLPLASRNYLQLTLVTPGAVTVQPSGFSSGKNTGEVARPEINGNRFTANDYVLDGMDNNQMSDNFVGYSPQPDAIQEFNLITQNAPADFGNYMGGIISAAIKSGTNNLHGSAFEFIRNDALNANEWSHKLNSDPTKWGQRAKLRWNQFGGSIGGPIIKNKLFFFADYEGLRNHTPSSTSTITVFTAKERTGDISELLAAGKSIIDPLTGQPFPTSVIPQNRLSQAALAIINSSYYPSASSSGLTGNSSNTVRTQSDTNQGDGKIDWQASDKDHLVGRYSRSYWNNPKLNSNDLAYNPYNFVSVWNAVVGYTRTISPNLLNDARLGVNYVQVGQNNTTANFSGNASDLFKIPGLPTSFLPSIQFNNNYVSGFGTKDSVNNYADTVIQYQDVVSYTHGRHNTRVGFQGWRTRQNGVFPGNSGDAGQFQFSGKYSGSGETDFLLGLPVSLGVAKVGPDWGQRGNIFGAFIQDDWRASNKLTINLGFRYEIHTPWYEVHNKEVNFDPISGAVLLPGENGNSRALYDTYTGIGNYQPRLGISYQLMPKTVVRMGYSLSSFMEGTGQGLRLPQNPPASTNTSVSYSSLAYPTTTLDQGYTPVTLNAQCTLAGLQSQSPLCYSGSVIMVWDKKLRPAASNQWNLFIEHQLSPSTTFQAGYVGQITKHLTVAEKLSQLRLVSPGVTAPSAYFTGAPAILAMGAIPLGTYSEANQNYNALQVSLKGRANHGLTYLLSYTWSHCLTNSVGFFGEGGQSSSQSAWWQNQYDQKADYGGCYFDVKQTFTGFLMYDLPFGKGRAYGANLNKVANAVVGDWRVSVIPTIRGGFPLTLGSSNDESNTGSWATRPQCVAPPHVFGKKKAVGQQGIQWFDPSSYAEPAAGTFGNCGVSSVRGPGEQNFDIGLAKTFPLHETQNLEFRVEFLNAFNHAILDAPNNGCSASPGQNCGASLTNLGVITSSEGARNIQFALKFNF